MRKPYTLLALVSSLVVLICLSSCSIRGTIGSSFNTRKYTPGYYFNIAGNKEKPSPFSRVKKIAALPKSFETKAVLPEQQGAKFSELVGNASINNKTVVSSASQQTISPKKLAIPATELKAISDGNKGDHDWADQERKDRNTNIMLALASIALGIGGIILLGSISFGIGAACIGLGTILSVIGLKRGSSSLLTFIGFIINVVGLVILIDYALVNGI